MWHPKEDGNAAEYLVRHKVSNVSSFEVKCIEWENFHLFT